MWKISAEALAYLAKQEVKELTVEQPACISGCCIPVSEPPRIRLGRGQEAASGSEDSQSRAGERYVMLEVEGIKINMPSYLAGVDVTIDLTRFLRREKLVIEGWNPV